jgi:hypothetical protein
VLTPAQRVCAAPLPEHPGVADWYPFAIFFLSIFLMSSLRFALDSPHLSLRMRASLVLRLHRAGVVSREPPAGWPAGAYPAQPASTLQHRPRPVLQRQDGHTEEAVRRRSTELDQPIIVCSNASDAQFRAAIAMAATGPNITFAVRLTRSSAYTLTRKIRGFQVTSLQQVREFQGAHP